MKAIKASRQSNHIDELVLEFEHQEQPLPGADECVVKVEYAGVNPSDVKAVLGAFPNAVWPRYTGRDFAGRVVDGPSELIGKEIWGTGGELGIRRNGSHAPYLIIPAKAFSEKPLHISMQEAAGVGVPFITAYEGLRRAGLPKPNDWLLIFGGNGKVGQATTQIATSFGAKVIIVEQSIHTYKGHTNSPVSVISSATENVVEAVKKITNGHGADIVYNTVGSPCFEDATRSMAYGATQIFISDNARKDVAFNIFNFYRNQNNFVGIDTQELDVVQCAQILNELKPKFNNGSLKPFPVADEYIFPVDRACEAYQRTYNGSKEKVILKMI
ncbi:MAG: Quinone oxidoreductase [Mucilaginibacter sp.]|nr:Quinone oxidoreductase [Mucilaginibacter sp.]